MLMLNINKGQGITFTNLYFLSYSYFTILALLAQFCYDSEDAILAPKFYTKSTRLRCGVHDLQQASWLDLV